MADDYIGVPIYPQADATRGARRGISRALRRQGHGEDAIAGRQAASRTLSSRLSLFAIWFQLAKIWLAG